MEIHIVDVRRIIRHNLKMILVLVVLSVLAAWLVSYYALKPQYEATATLLVKKPGSENQMVYDDFITSEKMVKTYSEIMKSRLVMEDVIANLKLTTTSEQLSKKISVRSDNESLLTSITVRDENFEQAVRIANEFADISMQKWNSIMQMSSVTIIDRAKQGENPEPVFPRPFLNIALAFILSLMAGIGIAFLRDFMDKSLKTEEEIEELFGLPVLGVIPVMKD